MKTAKQFIEEMFGLDEEELFMDCDVTWDKVFTIMDDYANYRDQSVTREDQNKLFIEAIEMFNKKEHTQDGRDMVMKHFTIKRINP